MSAETLEKCLFIFNYNEKTTKKRKRIKGFWMFSFVLHPSLCVLKLILVQICFFFVFEDSNLLKRFESLKKVSIIE